MRKATRIDDFHGVLPEKVMPTGGLHILERNGRLLLVKTYRHGGEISNAQARIWSLLVALGELDGAPGGIQVWCVWGVGEARRDVTIFDHRGRSGMKVMNRGEFRLAIQRWWDEDYA